MSVPHLALARKSRKKALLITTAVAVAVLVGGAVVATPLIQGNAAHSDASSTFASAKDALVAAQKDLTAAENELIAGRTLAGEKYTAATPLLTAIPADKLNDPATIEALKNALAVYATTAGLTLDESLNVVATETKAPAKPATIVTPDTTDELLEDAASLAKQTKTAVDAAKAIRAEVKDIEGAYPAIQTEQAAIVKSALDKGAAWAATFGGAERADQAAKDGFNASLEALKATDLTPATATAALGALNAAWTNIANSHTAGVEAERKRLAEEAAQSGNGYTDPGTGNYVAPPGGNGGGGGGGGGGTGTDGGGGGGGTGSNRQDAIVAQSSTSCFASTNNGQSAPYGSTIFVPFDAAWSETTEIAGYGWSVRWEC